MKLNPLTQPLDDGIISIYKVDNISEPGDLPKDGLTIKISNLRYKERTVGVTRYWTALQEQERIERMIRAPRINSVTANDVATLNGKQYEIVQVQYINDVDPPCMDLSLERLEVAYEIE